MRAVTGTTLPTTPELDSDVAGLRESGSRRLWCGALVLLLVCVGPLPVVWFGLDFLAPAHGTPNPAFPFRLSPAAMEWMTGSIVHTILESVAICAAVAVCALCVVQYLLTREVSLAVIGVALACAGALDSYHVLAADQLIHTSAAESSLIPFTWFVSRMFTATILLLGVGALVMAGSRLATAIRRVDRLLLFLLLIVGLAGLTLYSVTHIETFSQAIFPDRWIKRPYDLLPLVPFLLCGLVVLPKYRRAFPSAFAGSLLLSMIPQVATQLYMIFGSGALFDASFYIAHVLKALAYAIPCVGIMVAYVETFRRREHVEEQLRRYNAEVEAARLSQQRQSEEMSRQRDVLSKQTMELQSSTAELLRAQQMAEWANQDLLSVNRLHQRLFACRATDEVARQLTEALVEDFRAYFARVWLVQQGDICNECQLAERCRSKSDCLRLVASAGRYTHLDGARRRVPFGEGTIGKIAQTQRRLITNDAAHDPLVADHAWAVKHDLQSFVGLPLIRDGQLVGVMAMFSRHVLPMHVLESLELLGQLGVAAMTNVTQIKEIERANRAKSEFLANMSHEIRTPMTAILGFSEILQMSADQPEQLVALNTIRRNGNYLLTLINDILDLSKIEARRLEVERMSCSLPQCVAEVASLMRVRANAAALPLVIEYDGPLPETIETDPTRLRQILINLLGNAIKFTEVGEVRLVVRLVDTAQGPNQLQFEVVDSGIGMTPPQVERLFRPFTQADMSTTRRFGGTGLGLTISKRLTEMLGGTIHARSEVGVGSTFHFTIDPGPIQQTRIFQSGGEAISPPAEESLKLAVDSIRIAGQILLAEDGPDNQRLISHFLKKAGAEVTLADNGERAYELALLAADAGAPFDLILMDMQMPVMDGYQATRRLRDQGYRGPIIALTAHAMSGDREKCVAAGCNDYATKPIVRQTLIPLIQHYLEAGQARGAGSTTTAS